GLFGDALAGRLLRHDTREIDGIAVNDHLAHARAGFKTLDRHRENSWKDQFGGLSLARAARQRQSAERPESPALFVRRRATLRCRSRRGTRSAAVLTVRPCRAAKQILLTGQARQGRFPRLHRYLRHETFSARFLDGLAE